MTTPINAIIFDFGGVLLDWNPRNLYRRFFPDQPMAMEAFLAEIGFSEWNEQQDKGRPFAEGVLELTEQFPGYEQLIRAYKDHWEESVRGPIPGTVAILKRLKKRGLSLFGLSNWSAETFPIARKKFDFFDLFDDIVISGEVKLIKPDPAIYSLLMKRIGRVPEECILIDDSQANVEVARKMGFVSIPFQSPDQLEMELNRLGAL